MTIEDDRGRSPVFVVPHTHWDREWYEPAARFRQRLAGLLDEVVDLLESDNALTVFLLDGQTVLLEDYLAVRPERRRRVKRLARAGKLILGPWYVLTDELLPADETLVRNLLLGRADGESQGNWLAVGYSPDAFGHPAALPTILAGFGIERAMLWRGYGGERGQEQDLFRWKGPDGSVVLVHHLPGYEYGANLPDTRKALQAKWDEIRSLLEPRAAHRVLLVMNGADHHGPQRNIGHVAQTLNALAPAYEFCVASPAAYFDALPDTLSVPEVRGELRVFSLHGWTLQGVHATRAGLKAAIAVGERLLLRWAEPQAALAWASGGSDRRPLLWTAWREHLRNCFHDTISGTATDEVAQDAAACARHVATQARGILIDALHERLGQDPARARRVRDRWSPALVVVNPSPYERDGVVEATITVFEDSIAVGHLAGRQGGGENRKTLPPRLVAPDGSPTPMQVLSRYAAYERLDSPYDYPLQDRVTAFRVAVAARGVLGLGLRAYSVKPGQQDLSVERPVSARSGELSGAGCRVSGDARGGFAIQEDESGRRVRRLGVIVSERDEGDTYTFQPVEGDRPRAARWDPVRKVWGGPLVAAIARDFRLDNRARGTVYARLDAGSRLIRFIVEAENLTGNHRLRILFPLPSDCSAVQSIADMQYGPVLRRREEYDLREYPKEWPVKTAPMQRYVSVPGGLTVLARGRWEYELTDDGAIAVTLLRAVGDLSRGNLRARPGHAGWPVATPGAQELGRFRVELAITMPTVGPESHPREWGEVERLADEFHAPLGGMMLRYGIDVPKLVEGPSLEGQGLVFKSVKPSEDGQALVLRCVNVTAQSRHGVWTVPFPVERAVRARLDETPVGEIEVTRGGEIPFVAGPREVITLLLQL